MVVVGNPLAKNRTQVALAERDHEIQTLPPDGSDQSFTEAVGEGRQLQRMAT